MIQTTKLSHFDMSTNIFEKSEQKHILRDPSTLQTCLNISIFIVAPSFLSIEVMKSKLIACDYKTYDDKSLVIDMAKLNATYYTLFKTLPYFHKPNNLYLASLD